MDPIQHAIDTHGAKAVYDAAHRRLGGDSAPLAAVGLSAPDLARAYDIMARAYAQLSARERAADHWDVQQEMRRDRE